MQRDASVILHINSSFSQVKLQITFTFRVRKTAFRLGVGKGSKTATL